MEVVVCVSESIRVSSGAGTLVHQMIRHGKTPPLLPANLALLCLADTVQPPIRLDQCACWDAAVVVYPPQDLIRLLI